MNSWHKNSIKTESIELLKLEFEYAKESSLQAQQDRLAIVNFYLALYAAVGSISVGLNALENNTLGSFLPISFFVLSVISIIFILQLVRLRQAWIESVLAMNSIKNFFIERDGSLEEYIVWRTDTIPEPQKFKTISYLSAIVISILGTIAFYLGLLSIGIPSLIGILLGIVFLICSLAMYHYFLVYRI